MAEKKTNSYLLVVTVLLASAIVFLLILMVVLLGQFRFFAPASPTPASRATPPPMAQEVEPQIADREEVSSRSDSSKWQGVTGTTPFGTGFSDDFESGDLEGGQGSLFLSPWKKHSQDHEGAKVVRQSSDGQLQPAEGNFMAEIAGGGTLFHHISLHEAKEPTLTWSWAVSGLKEGHTVTLRDDVGGLLAELDSSTPPNTWQRQTVHLQLPPAGERVRFQFRLEGDEGASLFIDDVVIQDEG